MGDVSAAEWAAAQLSGWARVSPASNVAEGGRLRDWSESGVPSLTGRRDGPPLVPPGAAATAAIGAELAFAALAGTGSARTWHRLMAARAALTGTGRRAPWSVGGTCRAVHCADGWVAVSLARADDVAVVPAVVERDVEVGSDSDAWLVLDEWAGATTADVAAQRLQLLGVPAGALPAPGSWWAASRARQGEAGCPVERIEVADGPVRAAPPFVVDLSALWAGPLCAHLLGKAGAKVVTVEVADRPDGARLGNPVFYDELHAGFDSVVIDRASAEDRQMLDELLQRADVVVESSRPRALRSWGIEAREVCERSPTTWVSITAYGRRFEDRVGLGDDVAMAAGLAARQPADERPVPVGDAIADPLTGMHAAVHALASHLCGGSRILDVAMAEVVACTVAWAPAQTEVWRQV